MIELSWALTKPDAPKKFDSLVAGDFAQLKFAGAAAPDLSENLWVKVIGRTNNTDEYWAVLDDKPELIVDMPLDCQPIFKPCHVVDCITYNDDGIVLVDLWGKYWGEYKRSDEGDYPIQCAFGQIQDRGDFGVLGDGCFRGSKALRQFNKGISYKSNSKQQQEFDKASKSISERNQKVLWVHYVVEATLKEKVSELGISVRDYFPTLRTAQEEIWSVIKGNGLASNG